MAVISKDIKLYYKQGEGEYTVLTNLQEIPDIGGTSEALECTVLTDVAHMYTNGIKDYGDSLEFVFLYEKEQFLALDAFGDDEYGWKVELPDGMTCSFSGTGSVKLTGVGVNEVLTYTLAVKPTTEMVFA